MSNKKCPNCNNDTFEKITVYQIEENLTESFKSKFKCKSCSNEYSIEELV